MEMMTALVKGKGPMQSPDIAEPPQSRATQDPLYPLRFTPPHIHAMQRGYPQREPTVLEQPPVPSAHLGQGINVTGNPLPNHTGRNVNAVTNEDNWQAKGYVAEVMTPLRKVWEMMIENGLLCPPSRILKEESKKDQSFCDFHGIEGHDIQSCKEFRKLLQDMMDNKEVKVFDRVEGAEEGEICVSNNQSMASPYSVDRPLVIYYEAKKEEVSREVKPSLIIKVPTHFSYKDNNAVPWKYDVNIVVPEGEKSKVMNEDVSGVGHFTRSGRCYSPETVEPKKKVAGPSQKGKAPMYEVENDVETQLEQELEQEVKKDCE
ncbi:hypothetical protein GOBAR_DD03253 [Gossypium barbadense]|nr:hypothetical protein GOBAR_DD03253 [Gossypium barbadense]